MLFKNKRLNFQNYVKFRLQYWALSSKVAKKNLGDALTYELHV